MRVAFDSSAAAAHTGIGRYVRSLLPELRVRLGDGIVETAKPKARQADIFHAPWIDSALLRSPVPMVVTLHDLVPLKRRGELLRTSLGLRLRYLAVQRAVRVIVPSKVVAADAHERLDIDSDRITVIPEAAARSLRRRPEREVAAARKRYSLPDRYLLWVGGLERPEPRKRVAALADAPRRTPLVLVGKAGAWARQLDGVHLTGEVPDDDLAAIYTGAHALVFPSEDEGFGLPPVEALACGTPVVACDVPVMREVLGDRATFVDCDDIAALVGAAEAATRPAPAPLPWTWADAAAATVEVYEAAQASLGPASPRH